MMDHDRGTNPNPSYLSCFIRGHSLRRKRTAFGSIRRIKGVYPITVEQKKNTSGTNKRRRPKTGNTHRSGTDVGNFILNLFGIIPAIAYDEYIVSQLTHTHTHTHTSLCLSNSVADSTVHYQKTNVPEHRDSLATSSSGYHRPDAGDGVLSWHTW